MPPVFVSEDDFLLQNYTYELPQEQIAQYPPEQRGTSRLLTMRRNGALDLEHHMFSDLPDCLPEGALLVANNSRVLQARLLGSRSTGGKVEFLLLTPLPLVRAAATPVKGREDTWSAEVNGLVRSGGSVREGETLHFGAGISVTILECGTFGHRRVRMCWKGDVADAFAATGHIPLPPYIKRSDAEEDFSRYQIKGNTKDDVCFLNTSDGMLLAACSNGLYRYNEQDSLFVPFLLNEEKPHVRYLAEDGDKTLWIDTNKGLMRYSLEKKQFVSLPTLIQPFTQQCNNAVLISSNQLLFNTNNDFFVYHIQSNTLCNLSKDLEVKDFRCAATDHTGNIWVGTEYGIFVFNKLYQLIAHYEQSERDLSALNDSPIYSLYQDKAHNMWVGTYFGGVNYYIFGSDQFQIYPYGASFNHLSGKAVRQIINAPDNGLYIATEDGGLNYLNNKKEITRAERLHKQMQIYAKNIHSLWLDKDNSLWLGLFLKGALHYIPHLNRTVDYNLLSDEVSSGFCIIEDKNDHIWYGGLPAYS